MLKNCRAIAAILLLCGMYCAVVRASEINNHLDSPYVLDVWDLNDGLPGSSVISVVQTHDGYLWFATLYGLVRFDGVTFTVFDEANTPGLDSSRIVSLFEDSRSNLWVGTESAGVFIISQTGRVQKVQTVGNARAVHPVSICEDADGVVWLLMQDGRLGRFQNQQLEFVATCKAVIAEKSGHLWLGNDQGVFELVKAPAGVPAFAIGQNIPVRQKLEFLLASRSDGFWLIADGHIQKWQNYRMVSDWKSAPWGSTTVTTACEDKDGDLIVGTYGDGVYWFNSKGEARHLQLSSSYIQSVMIDREGSLWVGTDGKGIDRVKQKSFFVLPGSENSVVQSVSPDRRGGLWIGYNGNRIDHWSRGLSEKFSPVPDTNAAGVFAKAVFVDKKGRVFAGITGPLQSHLLELQGRQFVPIGEVPFDVSAIHEDRQGRLWVGTQAGLVLFDGDNSRFFSTAEGLPAVDVRAVADDEQGNIWIGTSGGLACLREGKITAFHKKDGLPSDDISSLLVDSDDVLWIGTRGSGLVRFSKNHWTHYATSEGLAGNSIGYLLEDGPNLWIGSNAGLTRVARKALNDFAGGLTNSIDTRIYVEADGLPTRECTGGTQPAACATTNGVLWFPTTQGLVFIDPSTLKTNSLPPPVVIESVSVQGQIQNTNRFAGTPAQIVVPPGRRDFQITYASLDLGAGKRSRFKYRLNEQEQESQWIDDETGNRLASYPKLLPGRYQFQVTACNEDGFWNQQPASLTIVVEPQLWQRSWFRAVAIFGLLAAIAGTVYYFSTQKLQRQLAFMRQQEALERERARIARDLHDQLGANLTQVALLAEMAESDKNLPEEVEDHAQQISQTARETTKALDEIVWAVNPSNDTLEGLVNYSGKYAQEYFGLAGLRYRVDIPSQLPDVTLPPDMRHNVFLAFKESVNNVVKHAQATEVHARLRLDESSFTFEIEDNGRGPAGAEQKTGRNGLRNMRKRMEDVGGNFSIGPANGKGTIVRLTAPIKNSQINAH